MSLYPPSTRFFLNLWTWGYEEIYKAIARTFGAKVCLRILPCDPCLTLGTQIHLDRYKHGVYSHITGDPFLRSIITRDETMTRFHACERFERCEQVRVNGRESHTPSGDHVVYVNPVNMSVANWQRYIAETAEQLRIGKLINHLVSCISHMRYRIVVYVTVGSWYRWRGTRHCPNYEVSLPYSNLEGWFRIRLTLPSKDLTLRACRRCLPDVSPKMHPRTPM